MSIISWLKNHKLVVLLTLIIVFLLFNSSPSFPLTTNKISPSSRSFSISSESVGGGSAPAAAPVPEVKNRMVIKESSLSLLVNKVVDSQKKILQKATEIGGYMVSSDLSNPQEEATATVIVRVPANKLNAALDYFKSISVKVISENLQGEDVTDQYTDLQAQLDTLNKTKIKFEEIMDKAVQIPDILEVQRELISLQSQIDSVKGQQQYYEKNAEMAKITIYLSTDELSLPYAPSEAWRPQAIFKEAVRSLVGSLRTLGTGVIWIVVYAIVWIPALIIVLFLRRKR